MNNSRYIIIGLVLFIAVVTFPFIGGIDRASSAPELSLDTPVINALEKKECIESTDFMRSRHMELLSDWKDAVSRDGLRVYTSSTGQTYNISLQNTCLNCHSNKQEFCDRCHEYAGQEPVCWNCHFAPGGDIQ